MKSLLRALLCLALSALLLVGTAGCLASPGSPAAPDNGAEALDAGSPFKHYFEQLTDNEKTAYNAILSAVTDFPNMIEIPALTKDEMQRMYTALLYDNPELFFLDNASTMRQSKKPTPRCAAGAAPSPRRSSMKRGSSRRPSGANAWCTTA